MPMALGFPARPSPILNVPQGVGGPHGTQARRPQELPSFNCSIGTESSGLGLRGIPGSLVPKTPRALKQGLGGALECVAGSTPGRSRRRGCSGPHTPPPPCTPSWAGPCPGLIPTTGAPPALGQAAVLGAQPVFLHPGHALGRVDQEGAGKMVLQGRPPGPWLNRGAQGPNNSLAWPEPQSMSSKPCPPWS